MVAVMQKLSVITEYEDTESFNCLTDNEVTAVLFTHFKSRQRIEGEDVPMEEADAPPRDDAPRRPGMAEANADREESPQTAEESARSRQLADPCWCNWQLV